MANINTIWREFGKNSQAGKLLYELYGVSNKPTINVPVPKKKSLTNNSLPTTQSRGKSMPKPQKAAMEINYPEPKKKFVPTLHKVDMIYKRKSEMQIREEMEKEKARFQLPINPPKNRKHDIEKLQDNFQFAERKVMPQGARMPYIKEEKEKMRNYKQDDAENYDDIKYNPRDFRGDKKSEIEFLYSKIMKEIDERYKHIEEMKALGKGKQVESVLLGEIKDRIDELKELEKMMKK